MYGVVVRWSGGTACPSGSFSEQEREKDKKRWKSETICKISVLQRCWKALKTVKLEIHAFITISMYPCMSQHCFNPFGTNNYVSYPLWNHTIMHTGLGLCVHTVCYDLNSLLLLSILVLLTNKHTQSPSLHEPATLHVWSHAYHCLFNIVEGVILVTVMRVIVTAQQEETKTVKELLLLVRVTAHSSAMLL